MRERRKNLYNVDYSVHSSIVIKREELFFLLPTYRQIHAFFVFFHKHLISLFLLWHTEQTDRDNKGLKSPEKEKEKPLLTGWICILFGFFNYTGPSRTDKPDNLNGEYRHSSTIQNRTVEIIKSKTKKKHSNNNKTKISLRGFAQ